MSTYTAATVPNRFVEANGIRFAYRRWGTVETHPLGKEDKDESDD
jgi:hypothetical protein